jgi:hypothetical protein
MAGRVREREISDDEGNHLKRIVCRGSGSVATWRRAQNGGRWSWAAGTLYGHIKNR